MHERNDTHDMHDSTQILSFISAYRFFGGNRSAMSSKESGAERLRKSKERKKEVSRETSRRCRENSKGPANSRKVALSLKNGQETKN